MSRALCLLRHQPGTVPADPLAAATCPPHLRPTACDFLTALKNNAVRGSLCYGNKCEGKFVYPNA